MDVCRTKIDSGSVFLIPRSLDHFVLLLSVWAVSSRDQRPRYPTVTLLDVAFNGTVLGGQVAVLSPATDT